MCHIFRYIRDNLTSFLFMLKIHAVSYLFIKPCLIFYPLFTKFHDLNLFYCQRLHPLSSQNLKAFATNILSVFHHTSCQKFKALTYYFCRSLFPCEQYIFISSIFQMISKDLIQEILPQLNLFLNLSCILKDVIIK